MVNVIGSFIACYVCLVSPAPVQLTRRFTAGDIDTYTVQAVLKSETRANGLQTWLPSEQRISYGFTTTVKQVLPDGSAMVNYKRPTLTVFEDDGFGSAGEKKQEKVNWDINLTLSPVSRILDSKDATKKARFAAKVENLKKAEDQDLDEYISEVYRMALLCGGLTSSLDIAPPLPLKKVAVGDTWKSTLSYQPQKLRGSEMAVQRVDLTYRYDGTGSFRKTAVQKVSATLELKSDFAKWLLQDSSEVDEDDAKLKMPISLKVNLQFSLDAKTLKTLFATAQSEGQIQLFTADSAETAEIEEKFKGTTTMLLGGTTKAKR